MPIDFALYEAAKAADAHLSALLEAQYGPKRAGTMRYLPAETGEIQEAMRAKLRADAAWHANIEETRASRGEG